MSHKKHLIVLSSPSGGGKTTLAKHLMKIRPELKFSISATTRKKRANEIEGKDYYFLSKDEFAEKIKNNELVEYEEIFGNYYGTMRSEVERNLHHNNILIFDVDVKGALNLKELYPEESLIIFVSPPDIETLRKRLTNRKTESNEEITIRLKRAEMEMKLSEDFDEIIINDKLENAFKDIEKIAEKYL